MSNIRSNCAALTERLQRINHLVLAAGYVSLTSTEETSEGLDRQLASRYYSRCFHIQLSPLKARESGQVMHGSCRFLVVGVLPRQSK